MWGEQIGCNHFFLNWSSVIDIALSLVKKHRVVSGRFGCRLNTRLMQIKDSKNGIIEKEDQHQGRYQEEDGVSKSDPNYMDPKEICVDPNQNS